MTAFGADRGETRRRVILTKEQFEAATKAFNPDQFGGEVKADTKGEGTDRERLLPTTQIETSSEEKHYSSSSSSSTHQTEEDLRDSLKTKLRDLLIRAFKKKYPRFFIGWGTFVISLDVFCSAFFLAVGSQGLRILEEVFSHGTEEEKLARIKEILAENFMQSLSYSEAGYLSFSALCNLIADLLTLTITGDMSDIMNGKFGPKNFTEDNKRWKNVLYYISLVSGLIHYNSLGSPDGAFITQLMLKNTISDPTWSLVVNLLVSQFFIVLGAKPYYMALDDGNCIKTIEAIFKTPAALRKQGCARTMMYSFDFLKCFLDSISVVGLRTGLNSASNDMYWFNVCGWESDHSVVTLVRWISNIAALIRISTTRLYKPVHLILLYNKCVLDLCKILSHIAEKNKAAAEKQAQLLLTAPDSKAVVPRVEVSRLKTGALITVGMIQYACFGIAATAFMPAPVAYALGALLGLNNTAVIYKTALCDAIAAHEKAVGLARNKSFVFDPEDSSDESTGIDLTTACRTIEDAAELYYARNRGILEEVIATRKGTKWDFLDKLAYFILYVSRFGLRLPAQFATMFSLLKAIGLGNVFDTLQKAALAVLVGGENCFNEGTNFAPFLVATFKRIAAMSALAKTDPTLFTRGCYCTFIEEVDTDQLEAAQKTLFGNLGIPLPGETTRTLASGFSDSELNYNLMPTSSTGTINTGNSKDVKETRLDIALEDIDEEEKDDKKPARKSNICDWFSCSWWSSPSKPKPSDKPSSTTGSQQATAADNSARGVENYSKILLSF